MALAGEAGVIPEGGARLVHESDWDLVVSFSATPHFGSKLHVLSFGANALPLAYSGSSWATPQRSNFLTARSARVDSSIENIDLRRLLERSVVANDPGPGARFGFSGLPPKALKLVTVGEEEAPWAVMVVLDNRTIWALPNETTQHVEWLAFVLRFLNGIDAERFPAEPDWRLKDEWATPEVRRSLAEIAAVEREREQVIAALADREGMARDALAAATGTGAPLLVRLLTDDGEELAAAVAEAFRAFGFEARDMDDHHDAKNGAKLEDLRVRLPSGEGLDWTALVEVKGYSKGARANDVAQVLGRPAMVYFQEEGREPDGLWHVVNALRGQDPSTRPRALSGASDLVVLKANGGCLIDTRDLFRAWRDVEEGAATAEEIRTSLMAGRERWEWPAEKASS